MIIPSKNNLSVKKNLTNLGFNPSWNNLEWHSRQKEVEMLFSKDGYNKKMPAVYNREEKAVLCDKKWNYNSNCPSPSSFWPSPRNCWNNGEGNATTEFCVPQKPSKTSVKQVNKKIPFSKGDSLFVHIKNYFESNNRWDKSQFCLGNFCVTPTPTPTSTKIKPTHTPTRTPALTKTLTATPTPTLTSTFGLTPTPTTTYGLDPTPTPTTTFGLTPTPTTTFGLALTPTPSYGLNLPTPTPTTTSIGNIVARLSSDVYLNLDFESIDSKLISQNDSIVNINLSIDEIASKGEIDGNVNCNDKKDNFSVETPPTTTTTTTTEEPTTTTTTTAAPTTLQLTSYQMWMNGLEVEYTSGSIYNKYEYMSRYSGSLSWIISDLVVNGTTVVGGGSEYNRTITSANTVYRDDGNGVGIANCVDMLNEIMVDFELTTRFETYSGSLIHANYYTADNFSLTITESYSLVDAVDPLNPSVYSILANGSGIKDGIGPVPDTDWETNR